MFVDINKRNSKLLVFCDDADLCSTCKNTKHCPLIQAIRQEIVILHYSDIIVGECGLYTKKEKKYVKD